MGRTLAQYDDVCFAKEVGPTGNGLHRLILLSQKVASGL